MTEPPRTPDGRYIVVDGVLWRATRPDLTEAERERLVHELMDARRAVGAGKRAGDDAAVAKARRSVDAAKIALGERGPVWWDDGAPDHDRHKVENTPYAGWWAGR
ncbi:hypothetical protein QLH51_06835 [Sphingomonas sp. 2R-10]|uniref:hypothetical protein n=1 Tax=Sphingomonas sp. 2R-10 TaxID=3045148 RepID=UPI000F79CF29|nr:hypothetical protein [Sphingomonas sp. 2R-10]MDJ0276506.1 hypothetical protein [Sphingomonas sp. 2R-10]